MAVKNLIFIKDYVGSFAENKDIARKIRIEQIEPMLKTHTEVVLDFNGIDGATQSFVHALISELIRAHTSDVLDKLIFKNCTEPVRQIISIVIDYMQQID